MFNLHLMSPYSLPKFLKRIDSLAFTNIDNSSRIKIYDNGLVYMTFFYSKLINADVPHPFQRWWTIVSLEIDGMYFLYCIP